MNNYLKYLLAGILFSQILFAGTFSSSYLQWSQPNSITLLAKVWGDEYRVWMETEIGYRVVKNNDGWFYYATLDSRGEFASSSYRVGIDFPPSSSYRLERSAQREAEINAFILRNDSGIVN